MAETEPLALAANSHLFETYRPKAGVYDEMCSAPGVLREHWRGPLATLETLYGDALDRCADEVQRLLQENGVTYNVHDDPSNTARAWRVDPVPVLMDSREWAGLTAGLAQRARLLDRLLADLYGPRNVIRQGLLPPELVYACPDFQRPCHQSLPNNRRWLVLHGADLARAPDGRFWVLRDQAKAPAGAGYALENRIILQRAMPELYRNAPLKRLAGFLEAARSTLKDMSLHNREQPRVVLLTPGPGARTYFEHAYLANYLSLSLVEGEDLAVREGRVWIKTLGGLQPVDVILRWVTDDFCDSLELRTDSLLGTPGLLQAVRGGGVVVANALGGGFVENPALLPFLPGLCRRLLDEELLLPSVDTWWCGQPRERDYVLAHLEELDICRIINPRELQSGARLSKEAKRALRERIKSRPYLYIGQRPFPMSATPVLEGDKLVPRPLVLRGFTVAQADGYRVMPGGLARVSSGLDNPEVSLQKGGISKDLWVLAPEPEQHISLLRQGSGPAALTRDGLDLPSRVADNLYWLGRYGERLDGATRLLRETLARLLEQERGDSEESCLNDLLEMLGLKLPEAAKSQQTRFLSIRSDLLALLSDPESEGGLQQIFAGMLRTGRAVRDHLGDDSWRILNRLRRNMQRVGLSTDVVRDMLNTNLMLLAAFFGHTNETMPHHQGWVFLDIGRHLERAINSLELLQLAFISATHPGAPLWEVVMTTTDNLTAYRRRYRSELHPNAILDLLLFDEGNPRSIGYLLRRLQAQIDRLPRGQDTPYRSAEERLILKAASTLQLADIETLAGLHGNAEAGAELAGLLESLHAPLIDLSDALAHSHFTHAEVPQQLVKMQA